MVREIAPGRAARWKCGAGVGAEPTLTVSLAQDASPGRVSQHGVAILQEALRSRGWNVQPAASLDAATAPLVVVAGASTGNGPAAQLLRETGGTLPTGAGGDHDQKNAVAR